MYKSTLALIMLTTTFMFTSTVFAQSVTNDKRPGSGTSTPDTSRPQDSSASPGTTGTPRSPGTPSTPGGSGTTGSTPGGTPSGSGTTGAPSDSGTYGTPGGSGTSTTPGGSGSQRY
ncbi:hypothetical protein [Nitrosomonas communis]|uniref:Uncharacterized protein n=1 Tax=Nitrosomonas communis TaxID=44574 RepID=A0A1I4R1C6_9PROT|nr:hypothetical protein [Nitrosomonas communis]SFM45776.1 hypothetical protein SAMN05421863_102951 [Nitrosomonas communis]